MKSKDKQVEPKPSFESYQYTRGRAMELLEDIRNPKRVAKKLAIPESVLLHWLRYDEEFAHFRKMLRNNRMIEEHKIRVLPRSRNDIEADMKAITEQREIAQELAATDALVCGGTIREAAAAAGVPFETVEEWATRDRFFIKGLACSLELYEKGEWR